MRTFLALMGLFMLMGCTHHKDCGFVENVSGHRISWKGKLPIHMHLHRSFPEKYISTLENAMKIWNKEAGEQLFVLDRGQDSSKTDKAHKDGVNTVYFYSTWEKDRAFEQARTSVYWKGDSIEEADIRVNAADFKFYLDGDKLQERQLAEQSSKESAVHLESLFVHELGHVLGLKHNDVNPSVMASFLRNRDIRVALTAVDHASLQCEYN